MAKSQITFRKKEREKKKRLKRQEKMEKRERTKLNNDRGKPLEDMMAYVDEQGNLSDTPPEKKYEFKEEHLLHPSEMEDEFRFGKVTYYNETENYGFIRDNVTKDSVYFNDKLAGISLTLDQRVKYKYKRTPRGNQISEVVVDA